MIYLWDMGLQDIQLLRCDEVLDWGREQQMLKSESEKKQSKNKFRSNIKRWDDENVPIKVLFVLDCGDPEKPLVNPENILHLAHRLFPCCIRVPKLVRLEVQSDSGDGAFK